MRKVTKEEIETVVTGLTEDDVLKLWNEVADDTGEIENVHRMDEFDDVFYGVPPIDIVRIAHDSCNFDPDDDAFTYSEYSEDLQSFSGVMDVIDIDRLVDEIYDKQDTFDCMELVMLFDSVEAECIKANEALLNLRAG